MLKFIKKLLTNKSQTSTSRSDEVESLYTINSSIDNRIIIHAKYEVGNEVWVADYFYDTFYPCRHPGKIEVIEIKISDKCRNIYYWININYGGEIRVEAYPETTCFGSYDECVKWCDEYNTRSAF